jgi:hypothetical protein
MSSTRQYLLAGLVCFVSFLILYGLTSRGALQTSDEVAVFASGVALATHGSLAIDELHWLDEHVNVGQKGPDGHLYTKYFAGNILSVAFVYKLTAKSDDQPYLQLGFGAEHPSELAPSATGARWAMELNAVWGALGMTALLLLLRRYFDWRTAILTVVLIGTCSDWWYQSRGLFSEVGAGAFLIASLCLAAHDKPYGSSAALAISMLFRPTNVLSLPIWGWTVWRKGPKALGSGLIIAAGVLILAAYNWIRFGSALDLGYRSGIFSVPFLQGLHAMFLSPGRSLFVYSPVLLLAIPGTWLFYKREKILTIICVVIAGGYVVVIAPVAPLGWGLSWGARLLTPIVPLLGLLIAPSLEHAWRNKWLGLAALLLGAMGLSVQLTALLRDPTRVMIEQVATGSVRYEDTLYTVHNSWLALQIRSLQTWRPCDLDSYPMRRLLTGCAH